jgi:hypothetical protein
VNETIFHLNLLPFQTFLHQSRVNFHVMLDSLHFVLVVVLVKERKMVIYDSLGRQSSHHATMSQVAELYTAERQHLSSRKALKHYFPEADNWEYGYKEGVLQNQGDFFLQFHFYFNPHLDTYFRFE